MDAWRANPKNRGRGWVDALPEITRAANHSYTRAIGTTPASAFPQPDSSRTIPATNRFDLEDRLDDDEAVDKEEEEATIRQYEEDTRAVALVILGDVHDKEVIVEKIIEDQCRAIAEMESSEEKVINEAAVAVASAESVVGAAHVTSATDTEPMIMCVIHPTAVNEPTTAALPTAAIEPSAPVLAGESGEVTGTEVVTAAASSSHNMTDTVDVHVNRPLADVRSDGSWEGMDADVQVWMEKRVRHNCPDEHDRRVEQRHMVEVGDVEPLWYAAKWSVFCPQLVQYVRVVGVVSDGNCGPASACSARLELRHQKKNATQAQIDECRKSVVDWLSDDRRRREYDNANDGKVGESDKLIWQCQRDGEHVYPDFFRVYSWIHKLNVFVLHLGVRTFDVDKNGDQPIDSTWSCYLYNTLTTSKEDGQELLHSDRPNTIAVLFHHIAHDKRQGTGHFEYLVDSDDHSLWHTNQPIVTQCLMAARRTNVVQDRLAFYAKQMESQEHNRKHALLFDVGQIALLQVRSEIIKKTSGAGETKNIYVRLLERRHLDRPQACYRVLSHAGVLSEDVHVSELVVCGQEMGQELLDRVLTPDDFSDKRCVSLMTAFRREVQRIRAERGETSGIASSPRRSTRPRAPTVRAKESDDQLETAAGKQGKKRGKLLAKLI